MVQGVIKDDERRAAREQNKRELRNWTRGRIVDKKLSGETTGREEFRNVTQGTPDAVHCLQMRGEYMFVAQGAGG